jgi:hypothetical protein
MSGKRAIRPWIAAIVIGVWLLTAAFVWISTVIHPAANVDVSLSVSELRFRTDAHKFLGPAAQREFLVSGIKFLEIRGSDLKARSDGREVSGNALVLTGDAQASCSFSDVSTSAFESVGPDPDTTVTLDWDPDSSPHSIGFTAHGPLQGTMTSQPSATHSVATFTCARVHMNDGPTMNVDGFFSPAGGDVLHFATGVDSRFDMSPVDPSAVGDTQIHVLDELHLSQTEPRSTEAKSVLLAPPAQRTNKVVFTDPLKEVPIPSAELLSLNPSKFFFVRKFEIRNGIQVDLSGKVTDIRLGPGSTGMETCMPTLFDHLKGQVVIWAMIASITAAIFGILERAGALPKPEPKTSNDTKSSSQTSDPNL